MSSPFDALVSGMQSVIFDTFAEQSATLAGSPVTVIIDRDVEVMNGTETDAYIRVITGTFPASVSPVRNQELALASGEVFRIGDEIETDLHHKRFILKQ